jgi:hypothetical protein
MNKFECAFLPLTNCSIPTYVTSCKTSNCVQNIPTTDAFSVFYTHANKFGKHIEKDTKIYKKMHKDRLIPLNSIQKKLLFDIDERSHYLYAAPYDVSTAYGTYNLSGKTLFIVGLFFYICSFYYLCGYFLYLCLIGWSTFYM